MKTQKLPIWILAIVMAFAFVFNSCTKDDTSSEANENLNAISAKAKAKKINADITVFPSGDISGTTDVATIETALNALPPSGVILMESGTFYINRTIIAPVGFSGTLRGVGIDETQINPVGDDATPYALSLINVQDGALPQQSSSILFFPDPTGTLNVSHFSSNLPDAFATDINYFGNQDLQSFITINFENNEAETHVSNLRLVGTDAHPSSSLLFKHQPLFGVNVLGNGFGFPSPVTGGTHTLSASTISKIGIQATIYQLLKDAHVEVSNNSYYDIKQINLRWLDGCTLDIYKNEMTTETFGALVVTQEGFPFPRANSSVRIHQNDISTAGFMPIEIGGVFGGTTNFDLLIEKNKVVNLGLDPLGFLPALAGIGIFEGNDGAIVRNNKVEGTADFGILNESNGCTFQGNNLQKFTPVIADYGLFGDNNTIIGKGNSTVLDTGVGNVVTGMTNVTGESIGERLQAAQAKRKEILGDLLDYQ